MELDDVERIVGETLVIEGNFEVSKYIDRGVISLAIQEVPCVDDASTRTERTQVRIWTNGVEAFFLVLDDGFSIAEFDWEAKSQEEIVRLLTRLGVAYLHGSGMEKERKTSFGRRRRYFELQLDGEIYLSADHR